MLMGDVLSFKTRLCNSYLGGAVCRYGPRCRFAHGPSDLRTQDENFKHGLTSEKALVVFQAAMRNRPAASLPLPVPANPSAIAPGAALSQAAAQMQQPFGLPPQKQQPFVVVPDGMTNESSVSWSMGSTNSLSFPSFGSAFVPPSPMLYMANQQQPNSLYTLLPAPVNPAGGAAGVASFVHYPHQLQVTPSAASQMMPQHGGMQPVYLPQPQPMVFMGYAGSPGPLPGPTPLQSQPQVVFPLWPG
jgi:hypothetical protein